jgi:hypothetical protein
MGQQSARGGARSLYTRTCIRRTKDWGDLVWARPVSCLRLPRNQGKAVPPAAARVALSEYAQNILSPDVRRSECGRHSKGSGYKVEMEARSPCGSGSIPCMVRLYRKRVEARQREPRRCAPQAMAEILLNPIIERQCALVLIFGKRRA